MATGSMPGALGTRHDPGFVPRGIRGKSFALPGPLGNDAWRMALLGAEGLLSGPPSARQRAELLVKRFRGRTGAAAFRHILRSAVAAGLLERVANPSAINQAASSLCGPASLLYDVATRDPVSYVSYVIALYETGVGQIGKLEVRPGNDLKEHDPGSTVEASDWIALASLRDSENFFFDYQAASNEFAGITLPHELEDWFRRAGYLEVVDEARVLVDQEEPNIRLADEYFSRGFRVCLFIHSNMLYKAKQSNGSVTPDHWIVLTSRVSFGSAIIEGASKRTISFTVYTWGQGRRGVPESGVLTVDDFLDNYYGFVAARY